MLNINKNFNLECHEYRHSDPNSYKNRSLKRLFYLYLSKWLIRHCFSLVIFVCLDQSLEFKNKVLPHINNHKTNQLIELLNNTSLPVTAHKRSKTPNRSRVDMSWKMGVCSNTPQARKKVKRKCFISLHTQGQWR